MARRYEHIYEVGEIVNNSLKIINQIRIKSGKQTQRGYVVKSLKYPDDKNDYEISEYDIKRGSGCIYVRGLKIIEENSLYSHEHIRPYIVDVEYAKTIAPYSKKLIKVKCYSCDNGEIKLVRPDNLLLDGFSCSICSTHTSYPELYFSSYLKSKNIENYPQFIFDDLTLVFDYKIVIDGVTYLVECNGSQHYQKNTHFGDSKGWGRQLAVDRVKANYCKEKGYNLIWLDCRESNFDFIKKQIDNNEILPSITEYEISLMLDLMQKNKRYDIKEIIRLYTVENLSTAKIGKIIGKSKNTVGRILKRNNVTMRKN